MQSLPINMPLPEWANDLQPGWEKDLPKATVKMIRDRYRDLIRLYLKRSELAQKVHVDQRGQRLTFEDKPYLLQPYLDANPNIVFQKSVQSAITTWAQCEIFAWVPTGFTYFYVFPKTTAKRLFVQDRLGKLRRYVGMYRDQIKESIGGTDNTNLIQIGSGTAIFASSETPSDFDQAPCDGFIIDDYHNCVQENATMSEDRISASPHKYRRWIGIPEIPDTGINELYQDSKQYEWHIRCESCNHWQSLDFFKHVCRQSGDTNYDLLDKRWQNEIRLFCVKCHKPIDRLAQGKWIAQNPDHHISGYKISKLFIARSQIWWLWERFQKGQTNRSILQQFYNRDLAEPYADIEYKLTKPVLRQLVAQSDYEKTPFNSKKLTTMGVDVGNALHVFIWEWDGEKCRAVFIGAVPDYKELRGLMDRYRPKVTVIDIAPERNKNREFQQDLIGTPFQDSVWLCSYPNLGDENRQKKIIPEPDQRLVKADRTQVLDDWLAALLSGSARLPKNAETIPQLFNHLVAPDRVKKEKDGKVEFHWIHKPTDPDDFFHAASYGLIAKALLPFTRSKLRVIGQRGLKAR